jgi:hypothetical protein
LGQMLRKKRQKCVRTEQRILQRRRRRLIHEI